MITGDTERLQPEGPRDAYWIVYILFFFLGLVRMTPWTFFLTATDYWMYKFRNVTLNSTAPEDRTVLQAEFASDSTISVRLLNIAFLLLTLFLGHKLFVNVRLLGALVILLVSFCVMTAAIFIDTDSWQFIFYICSMLLIGITSACAAVIDITVSGIIAKFPERYLGHYINGQGAAGIGTALLQILSLSTGLDTLPNAGVYFGLGIVFILFALILSILSMQKSTFYKYYLESYYEGAQTNQIYSWQELKEISIEIWPSIFVFTCYMVAYTPAISVAPLVVSDDRGSLWGDLYFIPVITYLVTSVCDTLGRECANKIPYTINDKLLCIISFIRIFIFVPLIMLCNALPRKHLPVIFPHDYQYIIIQIIFRLTSGYMVCVTSLNIRRTVASEKCNRSLQVFAVVSGTFIAIFSFLGTLSVDLL